ncbi:outer membrane lipoprotein-sorting protein [Altibacter sp.]|uniref:outer membrane lipoprotein-sorting protein n=1 Tax=Altibacter sp. TaxID=2024823 RepID=UPI000C970776|nr:outer membrane lipoprotein-sorting protein [Altibacter sp.]MAP54894.1 outer membrane lipoprotein-sorting protein [Altibacter sp.]|tara:strand:- start:45 stop:794 length:750 start_codon:yes stop_codon:yes gene_type:complete
MKTLQLFILAFLFAAAPLSAQTADEIIANYLENTGGTENWEKLDGIVFAGKLNMQGMQLPITQVMTKSGKQLMKADVQGQTFYQEVYDGETLWGTNQMTMAAEKSDAETTNNFKNNLNDFPDPFLNYKEKMYTVELIGNETIEGTETYKIKLVKEPIMVDGQEVEDVSYYYFDTENFVPIVVEEEITQGPGKGMIAQVKFSDYQEVDGLYFPFSIVQGVKDQPGMQITLTEIKLNPDIDETMFSYPEEK